MRLAGDEYYSPYFVLENAGGNVYNGPIVSMGASIEELQQYCDGIPPEKEREARKVCALYSLLLLRVQKGMLTVHGMHAKEG